MKANTDNRHLALVVNPASGTRSKHRVIQRVERRLTEAGYEIDTRLTKGPGHATELAREAAAEGALGVLACGGDGTVNEVATALCGTSTALGIIPTGSGNGLARHIDIPMDVDRAIDVIIEHRIRQCDYGTACDRPFFCTFGMGFDAAVSERFARQRRRGLMMYLKSTIDEFVHYNPDHYTITLPDGTVITEDAFLVVACNASQYGNNAFIAPEASITDGLLDITVVQRGNTFSRALVGLDMITGFIGRNALLHTFRATGATVERSSEGPAHIDGDPCRMPAKVEISCHAGQLPVFTTEKHGHFRPLLTPAALMLRDWGLGLKHLLRRQ